MRASRAVDGVPMLVRAGGVVLVVVVVVVVSWGAVSAVVVAAAVVVDEVVAFVVTAGVVVVFVDDVALPSGTACVGFADSGDYTHTHARARVVTRPRATHSPPAMTPRD
jgi:hypothetical protein